MQIIISEILYYCKSLIKSGITSDAKSQVLSAFTTHFICSLKQKQQFASVQF